MFEYNISHCAGWYAAAVQPSREHVAATHLRRLGFAVFSPFVARTVRHARRVTTTRAPLFPGYLFVSFDRACAAWRSINGSMGVRHLVTAGDEPLPLPKGLVEALAQFADKHGVVSFAKAAGGNPLIETFAALQSLDGQQRLAMLFDLFPAGVPVRTRAGEAMPA